MQAEKFHDLPLEDVMGDRFARYSKYIIQERALPDARYRLFRSVCGAALLTSICALACLICPPIQERRR